MTARVTAPQPKPVHLVTGAVSASCGKCGARPEPVHVIMPANEKSSFYCAECCVYCHPGELRLPAPREGA